MPYDKNGNEGASASVTVNDADLRSYSNNIIRHFGAQGGYVWTITAGSSNVQEEVPLNPYQTYSRALTLTDYSIAPSEGVYIADTGAYNDVGADKLVRVSTEIFMYRFYDDGTTTLINWDALTGPIDNWPRSYDVSSFGSVTTQWHDIQVIPYIRASLSADVNSYGDWQIARGEIFARRLTYKFVLKSLSNNITPFLGKITYRLEYD